MDELMTWVRKHIPLCVLLFVCALAGPIVIVHILFSMEAPTSWISAKWSAGDLLAYIAGFESFVGTMVLGIIAVYQTKQANRLQKTSVQGMQPLLSISSMQFYATTTCKGIAVGGRTFFELTDSYVDSAFLPEVTIYIGDAEIKYLKKFRMTILNASDTPISRIVFDQIEFPNFPSEGIDKIKEVGKIEKSRAVYSVEKSRNAIDCFLPPRGTFDVNVKIYFGDRITQKCWRNRDGDGRFSVNLILKNDSVYGVSCKESIEITKVGDERERIVHKVLQS
jgi:hypothetical protein